MGVGITRIKGGKGDLISVFIFFSLLTIFFIYKITIRNSGNDKSLGGRPEYDHTYDKK